ncbi:hypothetical protein ACHAXR_012885 [Thalassiosira sp. AJA248-18]
MEELGIASDRLTKVHDDQERAYDAVIAKLDNNESALKQRLNELNKTKLETARANGNANAADDDLVEVNAGGKIIAAKRSTLTQLKGSRLEALFGGQWDKAFQRDNDGRICLDVNSVCFQAIVDYLNELAISPPDDPPNLPSVDDEHEHILKHQLCLFRLNTLLLDSNIIKDEGHLIRLHHWLKEDFTDGDFSLIYRASTDGDGMFHSKCDHKGCTLAIIETVSGHVLGGYSNTSWSWGSHAANKAFLFVLYGSYVSRPCKMKLKNANDNQAVCNGHACGPIFGRGPDLLVGGSNVCLNFGHSYECRSTHNVSASFSIKEVEVFQVTEKSSQGAITPSKAQQTQLQSIVQPVEHFTSKVNDAINEKQRCLLHAESELLFLEDSLKDECDFIASFVNGDTKDVVVLNVSGTMMVTKRSTLRSVEESALAQQFDDSKWTEQGCNVPRVEEWTPDDVASWAKNDIDGIPDDVVSILKENEITGRELLAMSMEGLRMIGVKRAGTLCLLLKEIKKLEKASQNVATLIEHSPYCFGIILDFLRMKQLHSQGLAEEPALPKVCESQMGRFEKVVKYYFPGDCAKVILG